MHICLKVAYARIRFGGVRCLEAEEAYACILMAYTLENGPLGFYMGSGLLEVSYWAYYTVLIVLIEMRYPRYWDQRFRILVGTKWGIYTNHTNISI